MWTAETYPFELKANQYIKDGKLWEKIWSLDCQTPEIPEDLTKIDGYGNPKAKFQRTIPPEYMEILPEQIDEKQGIITYTKDQQEFIDRENERIFFTGYWCFIRGKLTWLPGWMYFGLCYWKTRTITDSDFLNYRDRQRRVLTFILNVWKYTKEKGTTYLKFRQDGATTWMHILAYWVVMSGDRKFVGLSSSDLELSEENYDELFNQPFKELPLWLIPGVYTQNKKELNLFVSRGQSTTKNKKIMEQQEGRGGTVTLRALTKRGFDGRRVDGSFPDEAGKWKKVAIMKWWAKQLPGLYGFGFIPTTVEEMAEGGSDYKQFWDASDATTIREAGHTQSMARNLFIPSSDGRPKHNDNLFIDEYGDSIIDDPDDEQWDWIITQSPNAERIGAKRYQQRRIRELLDGGFDDIAAEERRMYPENVEDAFGFLNTNCPYETGILEKLRATIEDNIDQWEADKKIKYGRFDWADKKNKAIPYFIEGNKKDKNNSPWAITWEPPKDTLCKYKVVGGMKVPINGKLGGFGLDMFAKSNPKGKGSKQAISGNRFFDKKYEQKNKDNIARFGKPLDDYFPTPARFAYYNHRNTITGWDYEQMLMGAIYFSMPIALESNRAESFVNYVIQKGYYGYLLKEWEIYGTEPQKTNADQVGIFVGGSEENKAGNVGDACDYQNDFLLGHSGYLDDFRYTITDPDQAIRFAFLEGVNEMLQFNIFDREKSDYPMSTVPINIYEFNACGYGDATNFVDHTVSGNVRTFRKGFFMTRRFA